MAVDRSDLRQLTKVGDHDTPTTHPRRTPDGSGIVFTVVDGESYATRRLAYIAADRTGMRSLTPSRYRDGTRS